MAVRLALFVLLALGLTGFGTVAWLSMRPPPAPHVAAPPPPPPPVKVLVAARPLHAGALLKPDDLTARDMPSAEVPHGAEEDSPAARAALVGAMVRHSLMPQEALLPNDVMHPGDRGFLAAVLGAGMRAVTVGVDAVSGSAGLIWPGDRVDLVLTQEIADPSAPPGRRIAGETVLRNVRVIAIDQHLVQGAGPGGSDPVAARTVTLEVTPADAERVAVASRLGRLALVVRAAEPAPVPEPAPPVTWGGDVSAALHDDGPGNGAMVRLFQGAGDAKEFRF
jgi:pilus assembly protein CpaB